MSDYGPLAPIVAYAGNLAAAALAFRVAWAGKVFNWEPEIAGLNKAPTKIAGLFSLITVAVIFAETRSDPDFVWLMWMSGIAAGTTLIGFLVYIFLKSTRAFSCPNDDQIVIRGFWLTQHAKNAIAGEEPYVLPGQTPPHNDKEFFCGSGRLPDRVWPVEAQALAQISLVLAYILFIAPGTIAVSAASIVIEKALAT